jgi:uncharacterized membrane protein
MINSVTSTRSPSGKPTPSASRLRGVDTTRGIALLGMMAVHSLYESNAAGQPTWTFAIFGGRAAAAFAVLAGVGIAFMTGRRRVRRSAALATAAALTTRALVVGAIGLTLGYADASFGAVISPYYAVLFLLAIPVVFLPTWLVAALGLAVAAGASALTHILLPHLPIPSLQNPTLKFLLHDPLGLLSELSITGEYPALPWIAYLCAGLVIGRLTLSRLRVAIGLLATGAILAVTAHVASATLLNRWGGLAHIWAAQPAGKLTVSETTELLALGGDGTTPTDTWWWLTIDAPHTSTPFDLLGTTGTATGALGAVLLIAHISRPGLHRLATLAQAPLAAAGSMTLTLYTAHIMFINSQYDQADATTSYLSQVAAALLLALAWRATAGRGPLETLVSALANRARRWATAASRRPPDPSHGPPPSPPVPWPPSPVPRAAHAAVPAGNGHPDREPV